MRKNKLTYVVLLYEKCVKIINFSAYGFISKNQIFETDIIESILDDDHFTIVYQLSLKLEWKQQKTEYLTRDKRRYK